MATTPRRPANPKDAAEALFKPAKKIAAPAVERPVIPNTREPVTLKIDSDVLAYFQAEGPGWQERINHALRAAMKTSSGL
ncbi:MULTISPECIES: BrnA antitoxin family protein [unclassified Shinella]|uniref:BrnA antitoxin family protein n=1 Tax=unclassified Shinella TaxID=2643062 RepID=UPI00225CEA01|nr:BrnA antitoxin family protein [Shinella sp. YE25]MDC7254597.1 BrnA antitoxin family protein [Shinella sp. YE25]CAI0337320.1 BrnA antitoxin family protein [Rhizobiaceae bacterium]CAK7255814.1 BrnA antitoxin family protein [Shinella sp. WSC3-e]